MIRINENTFPTYKRAFQDSSWVGHSLNPLYIETGKNVPSILFSGEDLSNTRFRPQSRYYKNLDFKGTNFSNSFFTDMTFINCDFRAALLTGAKFYNCTFRDSNFSGQDLSTVDFSKSVFDCINGTQKGFFEGVTPPSYVHPFAGEDIIAYKKVSIGSGTLLRGVAKLLIPADARRVQTLGRSRKMRAERAKVLEIQPLDWKSKTRSVTTAFSLWDAGFYYKVGEWAEPSHPFDPSFVDQCASGIHFFLTRHSAVTYRF